MKVIDIVLRGGAEVRRVVSDEHCVVFLEAIEKAVGAVPLDASGKPRRRRGPTKPILLRAEDVGGHPFYVDPDEVAALTVAEFELKDF